MAFFKGLPVCGLTLDIGADELRKSGEYRSPIGEPGRRRPEEEDAHSGGDEGLQLLPHAPGHGGGVGDEQRGIGIVTNVRASLCNDGVLDGISRNEIKGKVVLKKGLAQVQIGGFGKPVRPVLGAKHAFDAVPDCERGPTFKFSQEAITGFNQVSALLCRMPGGVMGEEMRGRPAPVTITHAVPVNAQHCHDTVAEWDRLGRFARVPGHGHRVAAAVGMAFAHGGGQDVGVAGCAR